MPRASASWNARSIESLLLLLLAAPTDRGVDLGDVLDEVGIHLGRLELEVAQHAFVDEAEPGRVVAVLQLERAAHHRRREEPLRLRAGTRHYFSPPRAPGTTRSWRKMPSPSLRVDTPSWFTSARWICRRSRALMGAIASTLPVRIAVWASRSAIAFTAGSPSWAKPPTSRFTHL